MRIEIIDKRLVITDVNQRWELDWGDLLVPPVKRLEYILFSFRSTSSNKGTYDIRIYPLDVVVPVHSGLDDLFTIIFSYYNLISRRRSWDDVTEQFDNLEQIGQVYPVGVPELVVGNNDTGTLWMWTTEWVDTHIPNKLGGIYNRTPFEFTNTDTPTIPNYQLLLAKIYSQNPSVSIWYYDENGNLVQGRESALTTMVDGLIDTIYFNLPQPMTGKIIIA